MSLLKKLFSQCAHPQGRMGQAMLKQFLDDAGFVNTEIHRMKPSYATIIGVKP